VWDVGHEVARALTDSGDRSGPFRRVRGGLGLAITDAIITAHGGQLSIESEPGVGTTVRARLPQTRAHPAPTPNTARRSSARRSSGADPRRSPSSSRHASMPANRARRGPPPQRRPARTQLQQQPTAGQGGALQPPRPLARGRARRIPRRCDEGFEALHVAGQQRTAIGRNVRRAAVTRSNRGRS